MLSGLFHDRGTFIFDQNKATLYRALRLELAQDTKLKQAMTDSMSLITAQISFLDSQLVLIHIPIEHYSFFLQSLLQLLFGEDHDEDAANIPWTNRHEFLNLSITHLECSVICSKSLAQKYILPLQQSLLNTFRIKDTTKDIINVSDETYIVIQVDGQGLDAGQRVLELTGPLAMAGLSIFFITTYFCDYILVPSKARRTVTVALEQRGFVFSKENDAFISQLSPSLTQKTHRRDESSSSESSHSQVEQFNLRAIPSTPPAKDIDELQARTFRKLKRCHVKPLSDESLKLVSCAGSREPNLKKEERLKNDLLQVFLATPKGALKHPESFISTPEELDLSVRFLSLTITALEPISILFEERLLPRLGKSLYGAKNADDLLVPIMFDLRHLAFETTGIIGGVAGRLSQGKRRQGSYIGEGDLSPTTAAVDTMNSFTEISFLSTAKAGTVMVRANQLERAVKQLNQAFDEVVDQP